MVRDGTRPGVVSAHVPTMGEPGVAEVLADVGPIGAAPPRGVVVVGVDGSGRTHRLDQLVAGTDAVRLPRFRGAVDLAPLLGAAREGRRPVLVDDAHLRPPEVLLRLAQVAEEGGVVLVGRRPTVRLPELAALDGAVASAGAVEVLAPLPDEAVAALLRAAWPGVPDEDALARAVTASAGSPAVATASAGWSGDERALPPALTALVQRRVALLPPRAAALVPVLAELGDLAALDPPVLARVVGVPVAELADAVGELLEAGLLVPGRDELVPAVAAVLRATAVAAARRARLAAVAAAVAGSAAPGADPAGQPPGATAVHRVAVRLREQGVRGAAAGALHLAVARALAPTDPAGARTWAREALGCLAESDEDRAEAALVAAEAAAVLGVPAPVADEPDGATDGRWAQRWAVVRGVRAAQDGRAARAVEEFESAGVAGRVLAAPLRFGAGLPADGERAAVPPSPAGLLGRAAAVAARPDDALPLVVEAAEAADRTPAGSLLPDAPHALGAVLAVLVGDATTADRLLGRALDHGPDGPRRTRHVLLRAWVGLRTGRYDEAVRVVGDGTGSAPQAREELVLACLAAGLARRSGDTTALRTAWARAEPLLVRRTVDLWQLEQLEELAVAGVRLRQEHRTEPVLAVLEEALAGLGRPPAWEAAMAWLRLQCAVVREDAAAAEEAAGRLGRAVPAPAPGGPPDGLRRARAQAGAAECWSRAVRGDVDADAVVEAGTRLVAAELPWEASRLAGQAAIRSADPVVARRLLERARELAAGGPPERSGAPDIVLSEREREVAELVRAGRTHREIGAQLYLSPKTVEHHVARMRSKLGAATRAEFLAALGRVLDGAGGTPDGRGGHPAGPLPAR